MSVDANPDTFPATESTDTVPPLSKGRGWTLLITCLGVFMLMLDLTVINVALPNIRADFGASFSELQWVLDAYALGLATFLVAAGSLADRLGRRRVFLVGMTTFTLASLACGLATTAGMLIVARIVQGLGGAILFAVGPALIGHIFTGAARKRAFGIFGGVGGLAIAFGPLIGGGLSSGIDWRWIFLVNVPIGAIAIVATLRRVVESRADNPPAFDLPGMVTFSAALTFLVLGLLRGEQEGWTSSLIIGSFVLAVVFAAAFILVQRIKGERAMFETSLFRNVTFNGLNATTLIANVSVMSAIFLFVTYIQTALGYSAWETGLRVLPLTGSLFAGAVIATPLSAKFPYRYIFGLSMAGIGTGLVLFLLVGVGDSWLTALPMMIVMGFGMGLYNPPRAELSVSTTEPERAGIASGINETFQQVGVVIGIAALGAFFQNRVRSAFTDNPATAALGGARHTVAEGAASGGANAVHSTLPAPVMKAIGDAADKAFVGGLHTTFLVGAVIAFLGLVVALVTIRQRDIHPASSELEDSPV